MKLQGVVICLCLLTSASRTEGCLWVHGTTIDGRFGRGEGVSPLIKIERAVAQRPNELKDLQETFAYEPDSPVQRLNDLAVQALLRGENADALRQLEEIERMHPGEYVTAANRGSVLELLGRDEEALTWILEGIRRNPESHMKAEWLHARVIQAKLSLRLDKGWLDDNWISGVDAKTITSVHALISDPGFYHYLFGMRGGIKTADQPTVSTLQGHKTLEEVRDALVAQLTVRVLFIKDPDPVMAQLFWELAQIESRVGFVQPAIDYLRYSVRYGRPESQVDAQVVEWRAIAESADRRLLLARVLVIVLVGSLAYFGIVGLRRLSDRLRDARNDR